MSQEVICVIKDEREDIFTSIKEIGTEAVYLTHEEAIDLVKRDSHALYLNIKGERVFITVGRNELGVEYLRTENDRETENHLLRLPYCRFRKYSPEVP